MIVVAALFIFSTARAQAVSEIEKLSRLNLLPTFKQSIKIGSVSSYDRRGSLGRDGLPGNDDAGTMSSWYVWNAIGLYPNAGQDFYYIGSPIFTRSTIDLGNNRKFVIEAQKSSAANKYAQSAAPDGKTLDRARLTHAEISSGGTLRLLMSDKPSSWGKANRPPSSNR